MARPIKIEIVGDSRKFEAALGKVDSKVSKLVKGAAKYGTLLAGGLVAGGVTVGGALLDLSTDLQDIDQKINTVFGDEGRAIAAWSDRINEQLGVTSTEVQLMAANIADLLKPMGATTSEAADLSREMVELAPALAEWSGGTMTAAQVSEVLAKAMLGEREQLKGLGISINQAEVDTRALAIAQGEGRDEITAMDKALATQQLIFEKSTDAQAGFSGGTETLGGQMNFLRAKFAEVREMLARKLLPVFVKVGDWLVTKGIPAAGELADKIGDVWNRHGPTVVRGLRSFVDRLQELWQRHGRRVTEFLTGFVSGVARIANSLRKNQPVMVGVLAVVTLALGQMAIAAGAAAVAAAAAAAPAIALAAAVGGLAAGVVWAYQNVEFFRDAVDGTARFVRDTVVPAFKVFGDRLGRTWEFFKIGVRVLLEFRDRTIRALTDFEDGIRRKLDNAWETLKSFPDRLLQLATLFKDVGKAVGSALLDGLKGGLTAAAGFVRDLGEAAWKAIKRLVNSNVIDKLNNAIPDRLNFGIFDIDLPDNPIPRLFKGTRDFPGGLAMVGEMGRELAVLPKGSQVISNRATEEVLAGRGGDTTINFYTNETGHSPEEIGSAIVWRLTLAGR